MNSIAAYPEIDQHKNLHAHFRGEVSSLVDAYNKNDATAAKRLAELVINWFSDHIVSIDMRYKSPVTTDHVDSRPMGLLTYDESRDET